MRHGRTVGPVFFMKKQNHIICLAVPVVITAIVFFLLQFVFLVGYVPSASMEPTLHQGSYILGIRFYGELETGDIVIFKHDEKLLVKRISAVGGDVIEHAGQELLVPNGCYYMLGDNLANSYDSRYWDDPFISESSIAAKLLLFAQ